MINIHGKVEGKGLELKVEQWDKSIASVIGEELHKQDTLLAKYIIKNYLSGAKLARRSGTLARTTRPDEVVIKKDKITGGVLFGVKYASVHVNLTGVSTRILAKPGKALAIPLSPMLTKAGVYKGSGSIRESYPDLVFIKRTSGRAPILARVTGKSITPMFVLVKSVTIKARVFLDVILKDRLNGIMKGISKAIDKGLK